MLKKKTQLILEIKFLNLLSKAKKNYQRLQKNEGLMPSG